METLIVKVKDDRKLDFVLELLRDLDYLEVSQESEPPAAAEPAPLSDAELAALMSEQKARTFLDTYGSWEGRDSATTPGTRSDSSTVSNPGMNF